MRRRPLPDGRSPNAPRDGFQAEPVLVAGEDFDRAVGMLGGFLGDGVFKVFFERRRLFRARRTSVFGRGSWIDIPQAFNASQPRWTATFSNPNSRARKAATFALVHKPPSSGGSFNRRRSLSSNSGFNTVAAEPLRRRRSPKDSATFGVVSAPRAARPSAEQRTSSQRLRQWCGPWREARSYAKCRVSRAFELETYRSRNASTLMRSR